MREITSIASLPVASQSSQARPEAAPSDPADTAQLGHSRRFRVPVLGKLAELVRTLSKATGQGPAETVSQTLVPMLGVALASAVLPHRALKLAQRQAPEAFQSLTGAVVKLANGPVEKSLGLNLQGALEAAAFLDSHLAPRDGQPSVLMESLAHSGTCLVYLGPERAQEARLLQTLIPGMVKNPEVIPPVIPPDLVPAYRHVMDQVSRGEFGVYIDLDGDPTRQTPTEMIAGEMAASLLQRKNQLGSAPSEPRAFLHETVTNLRGAQTHGDWLRQHDPTGHSRLTTIKRSLTPPWREHGTEAAPLGWRTPPDKVDLAYETLMACGSHAESGRLADLVVNLSLDTVSGGQSFWTRFLRDIGPERRSKVLERVARAWVDLNRAPVGPVVSKELLGKLDETPALPAYDPVRKEEFSDAYDRGQFLTRVIDRTLNGLGPDQRPRFLAQLRDEVLAQSGAVRERERELHKLFSYPGLPWTDLMLGRVDASHPDVDKGLQSLKSLEMSLRPAAGMTADWAPRRALVLRHLALAEWLAGSSTRYGDPQFRLPSQDKNRAYAVGQFFDAPVTRFVDASTPVTGRTLGPADAPREMRASIVLEGGGGKGFCFPECIEALSEQLAAGPAKVVVDEFVGTSAGALTALLLAAGLHGQELRDVMTRLDFMKFNGDFLNLQSAHDPKVRGLDRSGLFSMQEMHRTLQQVLADKLGIHDRPITFKDLPFKLRLTGTVQATNLPEDDPLRKLIAPDGSIVFNREDTPDFDAVGCALGSASFPLFFDSPQLHVARGSQVYWMQLLDGGVTNNLPLARASREEDSLLVMLPANYEVPEAQLSTLSFDNSGVEPIDRFNRQQYQEQLAPLGQFLDQAGAGRVVFGLNLTTPEEQTRPVVQGSDRERTLRFLELAGQAGLETYSAEEGAAQVDSQLRRPSGALAKLAANALMDVGGSQGQLQLSGLRLGATYRVRSTPAVGYEEVLATAASATTASGDRFREARFERS